MRFSVSQTLFNLTELFEVSTCNVYTAIYAIKTFIILSNVLFVIYIIIIICSIKYSDGISLIKLVAYLYIYIYIYYGYITGLSVVIPG